MAKFKEIKLKLNKRNIDSGSNIPKVKADDIKTLISDEQFNILTEGDKTPYLFSQAIQFPVVGNGDTYGEEFFKSFLERNKIYAFPGDKYGHSLSWATRQASHFYQIGGEIRGNVAYFKFYVPPETDSESNTSFIKDIKSNGIDLSLVSRVSYRYDEDKDEYLILSSEGGERNDAVGYGDGSMDQVVINKNENIEEGLGMEEVLKKLNALITSGELSIPDLMIKLNKSDMLKTDDDVAGLKVLNSVKKELGDDPIAKAKELKKSVKLNAETARENQLTAEFGKATEDNLVRNMAVSLLGDKVINADTLKEVRENALFLKIAGENADVNKQILNVDQSGRDGSALKSTSMEL